MGRGVEKDLTAKVLDKRHFYQCNKIRFKETVIMQFATANSKRLKENARKRNSSGSMFDIKNCEASKLPGSNKQDPASSS